MKYLWLWLGIILVIVPSWVTSLVLLGSSVTVIFALFWFFGAILIRDYIVDEVTEKIKRMIKDKK